MISVILAGGKGLRLWPESRKTRPKQLCKLINQQSMLDHTIDRLIKAGSNQVVIITNDELLPAIERQVGIRNDSEQIKILSEPEGKNTAPAVGLVLARCLDRQDDPVLGVFPADHHIVDEEAFMQSINKAIAAAKNGHIVTIGIEPDRPETGYGYIENSKWEIGEIPGVFQVGSFCEKPDLPTAQSYLETGKYMWNSGIYLGRAKTLLEEFAKYLPQIYEPLRGGYDNYIASYSALPDISLDYGIAEKSDRMTVVKAAFGWSDLGSWNALAELYKCDEQQNCCLGEDVVFLESSNCLVKQNEKPVVLFGAKDLLVVETDAVVLIADRQRDQDIRTLVDFLQDQNRYDLL